jgi:enamine deaminase RidA (YjgF/YER057c/UK114 family)
VPRQIVNPSAIHPPAGYSHCVHATGSRLVFLAGQVALDTNFQLVGEGDLRAQTRQAMANAQHALDELGADWNDVVKATVYTTQPHEYETVGAAMAEAMNGVEPPAQTIAGVTGLALPELLIEIEFVVSLA